MSQDSRCFFHISVMLIQEQFVDIYVLHRQGKGLRAIARELDISRNTVRSF